MAEQMLSVRWKDHTSELAVVYKRLLENNFLVDCTLSAEGQSLQAHRLALSACSPYFHMLFQEETGKHPFVILLDASFETLKAVIDFVYQGETQIPEGNLKAFLTLAQSLQIKGLNGFSQDNKSKNFSRNAAGNTPHNSSKDDQDTCGVQSISLSHKDSPEKSSQQVLDHPDHYLDTVHTNSSVPFEAYNASRDVGYDEVAEVTEIAVKQEPLFSAFSETVNKRLDNTKRNETLAAYFRNEMHGGTSFLFAERSSCGGPSHGNEESSMIIHPQQQQLMQSYEVASGRDVVEKCQPSQPVILVPKTEQFDDADSEEDMDEFDVSGRDTNEIYEEMEYPCGEQNLDQFSTARYPGRMEGCGYSYASPFQ